MPQRLYYSTSISGIRNNSDKREKDESSAKPEIVQDLPVDKDEPNMIFISNISFSRPISEIEQYGTYIAGNRPKKVEKSKTQNDVWILEYDQPIGRFLKSK